jgi:phosphatidylserine synthase 2
MLQMKDGIFYRPHPAFWRVVMGTAVLYLFGVVFLLFQTPAGAREIFSYIDPKLGKALPERSYAEDCRIFTPEDPVSSYRNIYNAVYDEFIVAHLLGWYSKAFLFRNFYISWTWSILFELCELSLAHILPNFKECWWDQVRTCDRA